MTPAETETPETAPADLTADPKVGIETLSVGTSDETITTLIADDGVQFQVPRSSWSELPTEGSSVRAFVDREDEPFFASVKMAEQLSTYDALESAAKAGDEVEGVVVAKVKSGFSVDIGVRAFLPASQATLRQGGLVPELVGERLNFKIDSFQSKRMNVVLTRRPILEAQRADAAKETLNRLSEGEVIGGEVVSFTNYGMFVDVGGVDGLVHQSDVRWGRSVDPKTVFQLGQRIDVKVLSVDRASGKVQLGTKQLSEDPWLKASDEYPEGRRIAGRVVSLTKYGAFVEVQPGLEGMIHVSEMSWTERVSDPKKVVSVGDQVEVVVLDVDHENRRMALGLKQAQPNPWEAWAAKYANGTKVSGPVTSITEFGVFVSLEPGLDGLVHVSDMKWNERVEDPKTLYKKGDEVEAVVLKLDSAGQRMSLGVKQLTEDPWKSIAKRYSRGTAVKGKVTRIADFGAFVEIEDGLEGLVHISQLSVDRVEKPGDVVTVNQEVETLVVAVDRKQRKIGLSMRAVHEGLDDDYRDYLQNDDAGFANPLANALANVSVNSSDE
ncbi:MAG: 30S ribosomal protein S1 [Myxococcota bacterium]